MEKKRSGRQRDRLWIRREQAVANHEAQNNVPKGTLAIQVHGLTDD